MPEDVFSIVGTTQGGSFRVERAVAEGGFSVIYRAQHGAFRAPVALKCLKVPGDLTAQEQAAYLEKFREEAELLFRLSASIPEVVRPLHVDTLSLKGGGFVPFLALEWLEGETLDEILARRLRSGQAPMGLFKLVKLLGPVARGLTRAHRFPGPTGTISIVHRDIKPQNLFVANVNGLETVKILDFGIATAMIAAEKGAGLGATASTDPVRAFTPRYAAPEQWDPDAFGQTGPWTDVWGLAITMVEALAGRPPIEGDHDAMKAIVLDPKRRPTPRALGVVIADEIEDAFTRALAVEPKSRTRYVETFWGQIETALGMSWSFKRRDVRRDSTGMPAVSGPRSARSMPREEPAHGGDRVSAVPLSVEPFSAPRSSAPDILVSTPPVLAAAPKSPVPSASPGLLPEVPALDPPLSAPPPDPSPAPSPANASGDDDDILSAAHAGQGPVPRGPADLLGDAVKPVDLLADVIPPPPSSRRLTPAPPPPSDPTAIGVEASIPQAEPAEVRVSLATGLGGAKAAPSPGPDATRAAADARSVERPSSAMRPFPGRPAPPPAPSAMVPTVLRLPLQMLAAGTVLTILDVVLARAIGSALSIGPVRLVWLGAILLVGGTAILFWRLLANEDR